VTIIIHGVISEIKAFCVWQRVILFLKIYALLKMLNKLTVRK